MYLKNLAIFEKLKMSSKIFLKCHAFLKKKPRILNKKSFTAIAALPQ
jgi:hypothetical protein